MNRTFFFAILLAAAFAAPAFAAETERLYLSGHGKDDPVQWDFTCSAGQNANKPSAPWGTREFHVRAPDRNSLQFFRRRTFFLQRPGFLTRCKGAVESAPPRGAIDARRGRVT